MWHVLKGILKKIVLTFFPEPFIRNFDWLRKPSLYRNLATLILTCGSNRGRKRILAVWDYKALPWSVGDPLVFIEYLSVLKIESKADAIDFCVVYDAENPIGNRGSRSSGHLIRPDTGQDFIVDFLPLFSTCPFPGSIFQFNDRNEFYRFLTKELDRYILFPPLSRHLSETYDLGGANGGSDRIHEMGVIQEFFNANGYIPFLRIGRKTESWAREFMLTNFPREARIVSLSLRSSSFPSARNADRDVWLSFIDRCKVAFPDVFFLFVGFRHEVFPGLSERPNVKIAKYFGTSLIEDLALIRTSLLYMGTSSGSNTIAQFSDLPYIIVQFEAFQYSDFGLREGDNFSFARKTQRMFSSSVSVTPDFLLFELDRLLNDVDCQNWRAELSKVSPHTGEHPSTPLGATSNSPA